MPQPVKFEIALEGSLWLLNRDGRRVSSYSHLDRATHDAVLQARELGGSGEPAQVFVIAAEGKVIEVDAGPTVSDRTPLPADDGVDHSRG